MKKLILLFAIIAFTGQMSFANEIETYCPKAPYDIQKGFGSFMSSVTGTSFLVQQVAEHEIAKSLKKELGTKFDVHIKTLGGSNLQNGKFKKLTIKGKNIAKDGIYASLVEAETLCEFNHVKLEKKDLYFVENMVLKYSAKITADDLKQTVASDAYKAAIDKMSFSIAGRNIAKITNSTIDIINNKIVMSYDMDYHSFLKIAIPSHVQFTAGLNVVNGKINFSNVHVGNTVTNTALRTILYVINYINPLKFETQTDKNTTAKVHLKNAQIVNNEILLDGIMVMPKNYSKK